MHGISRSSREKRPDSEAQLKRRIKFIAILAVMAVLVILDRGGLLSTPPSDDQSYDGVQALVTRAIDGDTIVIDLPDPKSETGSTRVRLWGIDTPELARNGNPAEPFAEEAKAFAHEMLAGQTVTLIIEPHRARDRWGRVLAHVQLENGDQFAVEILEAGYAYADDRWPHQWIDWFESAELQAKRDKVGLWSDN